MSGIEEMKLQVFQIALVGIGSRCRKDVVVFPPNDQCRRLVLAEISLPGRVVRNIVLIVVEQLQLYLRVSFEGKVLNVHVPVIRADTRFVPDSVGVLPFDAFESNEISQWRRIFGAAIVPVLFYGISEIGQALIVGVAILNDQ